MRALTLLALLILLAAPVSAATIYAVSTVNGGSLVRFDSASPGTITNVGDFTGLQGGEFIHAIDFRPANGVLYALGDTGRIYTVNLTTAVCTPVGSGPAFTPSGGDMSMDFNPVADRIRVVDTFDNSYRINPDTGTLSATDTDLNPASMDISAVAYDRSYAGTTATTLYGISSDSNELVRIGGVDGTPSPNGGAITAIGGTGVTFTSVVLGLDIEPVTGVAFAMIPVFVNPLNEYRLYTLNLTTGAATLVGAINTPLALVDIAVELTDDAAPVLTTPGPQSGNVGTDIVFSAANGNAISIADVDAAGHAIEVQLHAANGDVSLDSTTGLTFTTGDGSNDADMVFTGALADVNNALDGMDFSPTANGAAVILAQVSDLGATGVGGPLTDSALVLIAVGFDSGDNGSDESGGCVVGLGGAGAGLWLIALPALALWRRKKNQGSRR
ncbi:MAG: DUF4394 domain-containing protein [Planctomycetes bacterium]|nr:DUF4394 domain-containing protein [Planctomycetota bacterium]